MLSVIITYKGNKHGLSQLLVSLQPQLHSDDDIHILDMSHDQSGKEMAYLYGTSRCYLKVVTTIQPYNKINKKYQDAILVISDRCVIPVTLISSLKKIAKTSTFARIFPQFNEVPPLGAGWKVMDPNFSFYGNSTAMAVEVLPTSPIQTNPFCEMILNDDNVTGKATLMSECVCVLPDYVESL